MVGLDLLMEGEHARALGQDLETAKGIRSVLSSGPYRSSTLQSLDRIAPDASLPSKPAKNQETRRSSQQRRAISSRHRTRRPGDLVGWT